MFSRMTAGGQTMLGFLKMLSLVQVPSVLLWLQGVPSRGLCNKFKTCTREHRCTSSKTLFNSWYKMVYAVYKLICPLSSQVMLVKVRFNWVLLIYEPCCNSMTKADMRIPTEMRQLKHHKNMSTIATLWGTEENNNIFTDYWQIGGKM